MNNKEKEIAEKEVELYKKEKMLAVDIEIQNKIINSWESVQSARRENYEKQCILGIETAELKAKKDALVEVMGIKDKEILLLKELLVEAIKAFKSGASTK